MTARPMLKVTNSRRRCWICTCQPILEMQIWFDVAAESSLRTGGVGLPSREAAQGSFVCRCGIDYCNLTGQIHSEALSSRSILSHAVQGGIMPRRWL